MVMFFVLFAVRLLPFSILLKSNMHCDSAFPSIKDDNTEKQLTIRKTLKFRETLKVIDGKVLIYDRHIFILHVTNPIFISLHAIFSVLRCSYCKQRWTRLKISRSIPSPISTNSKKTLWRDCEEFAETRGQSYSLTTRRNERIQY